MANYASFLKLNGHSGAEKGLCFVDAHSHSGSEKLRIRITDYPYTIFSADHGKNIDLEKRPAKYSMSSI